MSSRTHRFGKVSRLLRWRHSLSAQRGGGNRTSAHGFRLEYIESRELLAVTASFSSGELAVVGDSAANDIEILSTFQGGFNWVIVKNDGATIFDGVAENVSTSEVTSIAVDAEGGSDEVSLVGVTAGAGYAGLDEAILVTGGAGSDTLTGSDFSEALLGGDGADLLQGAGGDDSLSGGGGNDSLEGGGGADLYVFDYAPGTAETVEIDDSFGPSYFGMQTLTVAVTLNLNSYSHTPLANLTINVSDLIDGVWSGSGNDTLVGNAGDNFLGGGGGSDSIIGGAGNDIMAGMAGADYLSGGDGEDTLAGDQFDEAIDAIGGNDTIWGGADDDILVGGEVDDSLQGEGGNDIILGDSEYVNSGYAGNDWVDGGAGADLILGEGYLGAGGGDTLYGGDDNDIIRGNGGDDSIHPGPGNDLAAGDSGNDGLGNDAGDDTLVGGTGHDIYQHMVDIDYGSDVFVESTETTHDDLQDNVWFPDSYARDLTIDLGAMNSIQTVAKDASNNPLLRITLRASDDYFDPGGPTWESDHVFEQAFGGSGNDYIKASDYTVNLNYDSFLFGGFGDDTLIGGDIPDIVLGDDGDILLGGPGNDLLIGNAGSDLFLGGDFVYSMGDDTLDGGADADKFVFSARPLVDSTVTVDDDSGLNAIVFGAVGGSPSQPVILDDVTLDLTLDDGTPQTAFTDSISGADQIIKLMAGATFTTVTGGQGNDLIIGSDGTEIIDGLAGNDTIDGNGGDDVLFGGSGNDSIEGGSGRDLVVGDVGLYVVDVGTPGADTLVGGAADDVLVSGDWNFVIWQDPVLLPALDIWRGSGDFDDRIEYILALTGFSDQVFDDDSAVDLLTGNEGDDWFLYRFDEDTVTSFESIEADFDEDIG